MTVILTLDTGESVTLDRGLWASGVSEQINAARGGGKLIPFQDNRTPSRTVYVDPDHVIKIKDDGYAY